MFVAQRRPVFSKRSALRALFLALMVLLAACSGEPQASVDPAPAVDDQDPLARQIGQGDSRLVGTGEIDEGACVDLPDSTEQLTGFTEVSCFEAHEAQIAAIFDLPLEGDFPGQDEILLDAQTGCVARFEGFIGLGYDDSIYFLQSFTPTEASWNDLDDRSVVCVILPPAGEDLLVGDLRGVTE